MSSGGHTKFSDSLSNKLLVSLDGTSSRPKKTQSTLSPHEQNQDQLWLSTNRRTSSVKRLYKTFRGGFIIVPWGATHGLQRLQRSHNQATRTVIVQPGLLAFSPPVFLHLDEIIDSENNIKEIFFLKRHSNLHLSTMHLQQTPQLQTAHHDQYM